ncbi:MAG: hypothetical protein ACLGJC_09610 [Alphaproteobacteria bacterium]
MADHTPTDETVLPAGGSPLPPADLTRFGWAPGNYQCVRCDDCGRVFEGAKRCFRCRPCAEKMAAGYGIGNQQSSEDYQRVDGGRSSEGNQPAAPISTVYKVECSHCHRMTAVARDTVDMIRADAIEALTAKNQRLTDALNTTAFEACEAIDDRLKPEIDRLTAENADLRHDIERYIAAASAEAEGVERLKFELRTERRASQEMAQQYLADFGQRYQPETYATKQGADDAAFAAVVRRQMDRADASKDGD